jgi:hypothetical protein
MNGSAAFFANGAKIVPVSFLRWRGTGQVAIFAVSVIARDGFLLG